MKLSAPSLGMFFVSTILVVLIVLDRYFDVSIPILTVIVEQRPFEVALLAWGVLFASVAFNL